MQGEPHWFGSRREAVPIPSPLYITRTAARTHADGCHLGFRVSEGEAVCSKIWRQNRLGRCD